MDSSYNHLLINQLRLVGQFSERVVMGEQLSPAEALCYRAGLAAIQAYYRMTELAYRAVIEEQERTIYGPDSLDVRPVEGSGEPEQD